MASVLHNVTRIAPNHGPTYGGTKAFLYGKFQQGVNYSVRFDYNAIVTASLDSDHQLEFHTPAHNTAVAVPIEIRADGEVTNSNTLKWTLVFVDVLKLNGIAGQLDSAERDF